MLNDLKLLDILEMNGAEAFASKHQYRMIKSGKVTRVNSSPNRIDFGGEKFIGSFIYDNDKLKNIILIPVIGGIEIPNFPSEEYQDTKKEHCVHILKKIYGENYEIIENGVRWKTPMYDIGTYVVNGGKDKYSGGNIWINMR